MEHTLFINLQHRVDRLLAVREEFKSLGVQPIRMEAIRQNPGSVGCTLSHIACLEHAIREQWPRVCICEDDFHVTDPPRFLHHLHACLDELTTWDVLLLGGNIGPPYVNHNHCMQVRNAQTTTAYIVQAHYYHVLLANFKESASMAFQHYPPQQCAIDMHWKRLQAKDLWFILTPLMVTQRPGYSDIEGRVVNYEAAMLSCKVLPNTQVKP